MAVVETSGSTTKALTGSGANGAKQVRPLVALLAQAARPLAAYPPAMAGATLRADPALILEPQLDALVGVRLGDRLYGLQQPPLTGAALARSPACGCSARVFCRDRSSRRMIRDRLAGCRRLRPSANPSRRVPPQHHSLLLKVLLANLRLFYCFNWEIVFLKQAINCFSHKMYKRLSSFKTKTLKLIKRRFIDKYRDRPFSFTGRRFWPFSLIVLLGVHYGILKIRHKF
jgi:hypothetical protein